MTESINTLDGRN